MSDREKLIERLREVTLLLNGLGRYTEQEWVHEAITALSEPRLPESSADFQQRRGVAWDIIDEAINTFDSWMLDDDYRAGEVLREIIEKMKERRAAFLPAEPVEAKPEHKIVAGLKEAVAHAKGASGSARETIYPTGPDTAKPERESLEQAFCRDLPGQFGGASIDGLDEWVFNPELDPNTREAFAWLLRKLDGGK